MLCTIITGPSDNQARKQIQEALPIADVVELRLDLLSSPDIISTVLWLRSEFSIPMICTLRTVKQGGTYQGSIAEYCSIIENLAILRVEYVDIEDQIPPEFARKLTARYPKTKILISHHDFLKTPSALDEIYHRMAKTPAFAYKMAFTANNSLDMMRLIAWREKQRDVIAISMGCLGQASRILGPIIGNYITYASLTDNEQTAPGQISANELLRKYHFNSLGPQTEIYGLIGDPVSRSIGDIVHNALCAHIGINAVYVKIQISGSEISEFLHIAKSIPFAGLSVTMPLKEAIIPHLDCIDSNAHNIGAVNTLCFKDGKVSGYNTDGIGALSAIEQVVSVHGKRIVIIGAGGAAKAIAYEAQRRGALVTIVVRNETMLKRGSISLAYNTIRINEMNQCVQSGYDILINCTPAAMPISSQNIIPKSIVMDITTQPMITTFLQEAKAKHCRILYGYAMFVEQASYQWKLWKGTLIHRKHCKEFLEKIACESLQPST